MSALKYDVRIKDHKPWPAPVWCVCHHDTGEVLCVTGTRHDENADANARGLASILNRVSTSELRKAENHA